MKVYLAVVALTALISFALTPMARMLGVRGRVYTPSRKRDMHRRPIPKTWERRCIRHYRAGRRLDRAVSLRHLSGTHTGYSAGHSGGLDHGGHQMICGTAWIVVAGQIVCRRNRSRRGIRVEAMPVGWIHVNNELAQIAITIVVIVLTINAFNFIDGLDGLAAGVAVIGGSAFFYLQLHSDPHDQCL